MRSVFVGGSVLLLGVACFTAGCIGTIGETNGFVTLVEDLLNVPIGGDGGDGGGGGGGGGAEDVAFRRDMSLTLANNAAGADLNVWLAAWVEASSIRSAEQQDALIDAGYVQLQREVTLGVLSLPAGTFVLAGPGAGGARRVVVPSAQPGANPLVGNVTLAAGTALTEQLTIMTPDRILFFTEPPVSCESVAFFFTRDGEILDSPALSQGGDEEFEGANFRLGRKTYAQISAYICDPFDPGLALLQGGGVAESNQYREGDAIRVDFFLDARVTGFGAMVEIGG